MLPVMAMFAVAVPLLGVATVMLMSTPDADKHHMIRQVTVLRLPPPPPPPPEKPPEPPKPKDEIKLDQPKPVDAPKADQSEPPPGPLGLDAKGTGPGDAFGLAGRPGGRDIVLGGSGGGELAAMTFGNGAARHIAQELARNPALKGANFRIEIYVWVSKDGRFEREVIARGSGNPELDARIREALTQVSPLRQPLPPDITQPLRILVTSSDA
jgi:protein TonB